METKENGHQKCKIKKIKNKQENISVTHGIVSKLRIKKCVHTKLSGIPRTIVMDWPSEV